MGHQALLPTLSILFPSYMKALSFPSKYWDDHLSVFCTLLFSLQLQGILLK